MGGQDALPCKQSHKSLVMKNSASETENLKANAGITQSIEVLSIYERTACVISAKETNLDWTHKKPSRKSETLYRPLEVHSMH